MAEHKTLLEFLMDLLNNHDALADFRADPHEALQAAGLGNVCVDDIKELLPVVLEKVDAEKCAQYEDDCDDDKCWDSEPKHHDGEHHHHRPIDCDDEGRPAPHCSEIDKVVTHLNYVTNNYSYDSHDTFVTNNNITKIWAGDNADINVDNHNTTAGAGGVAVGGDNNAPIATGGHNQIGDDNQMSGDGSTTAFGAGSALSHVGTGDGGAISVNGPATATNAFGDGSQAAAPGGSNLHTDSHDDNSSTLHDVGNTDNSHHGSDNVDVKVHDSFNPDSSVNTEDSGNPVTHVGDDIQAHDSTVDTSGLHALPLG